MLKALGVKDNLNLSNVTENDDNKLRALVKAIVHDEPIYVKEEVQLISRITICNICVAVITYHIGENKYNLYNFFNHDIYAYLKDEAIYEEEIRVSQFLIMKKDDFLKLSNIDYNKICKDITSIPTSEIYNSYVNDFLLRMLNAYDEQIDKNKELIDTISKINRWLSKNAINEDERIIYLINYYQVNKRKRKLKRQDKKDLQNMLDKVEIMEETPFRQQIIICIYILLEEYKKANALLKKLEVSHKEKLKETPIMRLLPEV